MIVIRLNAKKTAVPIATNSLLTCLEVYGRTISRYLGRREFFYRYQPYMLINYRQLQRIFQRKKSIFRTSALKICFLSLCLTFPHFPQLYFCSASRPHPSTSKPTPCFSVFRQMKWPFSGVEQSSPNGGTGRGEG